MHSSRCPQSKRWLWSGSVCGQSNGQKVIEQKQKVDGQTDER